MTSHAGRVFIPIVVELPYPVSPATHLCNVVNHSIEHNGGTGDIYCLWCKGFNRPTDHSSPTEDGKWFGHDQDCPVVTVYEFLVDTKVIKETP